MWSPDLLVRVEKMIAYFAHSKLDYGSTREKAAIAAAERVGLRVFCPNNNLGETGKIENYLAVLSWCDSVFVLEHGGHVGRGVYSEVAHALQLQKPVVVLRRGQFYAVTGLKEIDNGDWKIRFGKLKVKPQKVSF